MLGRRFLKQDTNTMNYERKRLIKWTSKLKTPALQTSQLRKQKGVKTNTTLSIKYTSIENLQIKKFKCQKKR